MQDEDEHERGVVDQLGAGSAEIEPRSVVRATVPVANGQLCYEPDAAWNETSRSSTAGILHRNGG
jgi:hypothetical protein